MKKLLALLLSIVMLLSLCACAGGSEEEEEEDNEPKSKYPITYEVLNPDGEAITFYLMDKDNAEALGTSQRINEDDLASMGIEADDAQMAVITRYVGTYQKNGDTITFSFDKLYQCVEVTGDDRESVIEQYKSKMVDIMPEELKDQVDDLFTEEGLDMSEQMGGDRMVIALETDDDQVLTMTLYEARGEIVSSVCTFYSGRPQKLKEEILYRDGIAYWIRTYDEQGELLEDREIMPGDPLYPSTPDEQPGPGIPVEPDDPSVP